MPKRRLTLFLLRESVNDPLTALRESPEITYSLKDTVSADGKLVVRTTPKPVPPKWADFVESASATSLTPLSVASSSAVMFIPAERRWFAITFGYGRALLDEDQIEPMFGLKTVVNRVDPENLRSIDIKTFQATQFQIRQQATGTTPLDTFGLNVRRDILNAVAGKPSNSELGSTLAGRDSLSLSVDVSADGLVNLCKLAFNAFKDTKYKERFGWIDTLQPVKDQREIARLDGDLLKAIQSGSDDASLGLAVPDILDPERLSGFRYTGHGSSSELYTDLDIVTLRDIVAKTGKLSADWLKKQKIAYFFENDTTPSGHWTIYKCLFAQISDSHGTHVLSLGQWYEVEPSYVQEVDAYVADRTSLPLSDICFPDNEDETNGEEEYNAFTAQLLDMRCQDQQFVYLGGQRNKIEPCDLLSRDGKLIHVKRKTRSSTLSHLYAQARVSSELLRREQSFFSKWQDQIKKDKSDPKAKEYLKAITWPCNPAKHEVILVVLAANPEQLPEKLPFFAKIELMGLAQLLSEVGYRMSFGSAFEIAKTKKKPPSSGSKAKKT